MMDYQKKEWKNRETEYPNRRVLTPTGTENTFDVARDEGLVLEPGEAFSAENMNDLENRIGEAFQSKATLYSATAEMQGGTLVVTSEAPVEVTAYPVRFIMPAGYAVGAPILIDGVNVNIVVLDGDEAELEAIEGAPVQLERDGDYAFFKSGGAGLNFKIVGSPTRPEIGLKENLIWVNTSTPIVGYSFYPSAPANPVEGYVWLKTSNSTDALIQFNALKSSNVPDTAISKKDLHAIVTALQQYVGGVWITPEANIYQNGAWMDFQTWLFNQGDENVSFTGGWAFATFADTYGTGLVARNDGTQIILQAQQFGGAMATVNNGKDLTNFTTMRLTFRMTSASTLLRFRILAHTSKYTPSSLKAALGTSSATTVAGQVYIAGTSSISQRTIDINIASLTGIRYIQAAIATRDLQNGTQYALAAYIKSIEFI
jgi:hypothetical protein